MPRFADGLKQTVVNEVAWFVGLLFFGFVLMPVPIYLIGDRMFGNYGGDGYFEFFSVLSGRVRAGDRVTWFLVLSPYLLFLTLRLTLFAWRKAARA